MASAVSRSKLEYMHNENCCAEYQLSTMAIAVVAIARAINGCGKQSGLEVHYKTRVILTLLQLEYMYYPYYPGSILLCL